MTAGIGRTQFSGNASATTLVNELTPVGVGTISVADSTNWPNGAVGNFTACIDRGGTLEEKVRCSGSSGTVNGTITIIAGGRGYDGTVAVDHGPGAPVELVIDAATMTDIEGHIYDDTRDDPGHQHYLTAGRHDVGARHTFGNAFTQGLLGDMATMSPLSGTGAAGSTGHVPDAGHSHPLGVPLVGAVTTSSPGDVAAVGATGTFADNGHRHAREAAVWSTYTPTWTGFGSNPALGNGTIVGKYRASGKSLTFSITIVAGSTTTYGTGGWILTLPGGFTSATDRQQCFPCFGTPAGSAMGGMCVLNASSTGFAIYMTTSASVATLVGPDATHPLTWAATNVFVCQGTVETT